MKITQQNLADFNLIDQIHAGFIELPGARKLQNALEKAGGELRLQPTNLLNVDLQTQLVVKCKHTGTTYAIAA
ncbi:MAG: hypothetical protein JXR44_00505 [Thiotrichales bacterium]|nr:hypothetical protein [Thiotrichales bacterium]